MDKPNQVHLVGAVLVFKPGISEEKARQALKALAEITEKPNVQVFDPYYGGPVFYIP